MHQDSQNQKFLGMMGHVLEQNKKIEDLLGERELIGTTSSIGRGILAKEAKS